MPRAPASGLPAPIACFVDDLGDHTSGCDLEGIMGDEPRQVDVAGAVQGDALRPV